MPFDQMAKRKDGPMKFQPVAKEERQKLARRGQDVQQSREQRRTVEAKAADATDRRPGAAFEPAKVQLPRSPIVAKSASQLGKNQAPPKAQSSPKPDTKFQPKPEDHGRQPNVDRSNPQPEPRRSSPEMKPVPGQGEATPRERRVQPEPQPSAKEPGAKVQEAPPSDARGLGRSSQPAMEPPARQRPDTDSKGATKLFRNDRPQPGNDSQPAPRNSPAPPQVRENPPASDHNPPNAPDKDRERKNR